MKHLSIILSLFMISFSIGCTTKTVKTAETVCENADNLNWVKGINECFRIKTLDLFATESSNNLIVYLHGDGSKGGPSDYLSYAARNLYPDTEDVVQVILIRPGYFDSEKNYSTGISNRRSYSGTSYNEHNVREIAAAIKKLKEKHNSQKVYIVGHSGGAALAALILGKHPNVANGAVLAGCPCDLNTWTSMHRWKRGTGSLSPHNYIEDIKSDIKVTAITGSNDKDTFPSLGRKYVEALQEKNVNAKFIMIKGQTHNGIVRTYDFYKAISEILK